MCGEKRTSYAVQQLDQGSPPHVRGKAPRLPQWAPITRITPACAGKRELSILVYCVSEDHPRMCGEKPAAGSKKERKTGSPPHVRGKALCLKGSRLDAGITPACAGKRLHGRPSSCQFRDHPRMCGEKLLYQTSSSLSPWITPACAGKRLKRSRSIVPHAAIVPLFPSVCNKPAGSDGSPAGHDAPPFLPIENAAPASPAYNLRSL